MSERPDDFPPKLRELDPWGAATPEGLELARLRDGAMTPLIDKVRWLEQMHRMVLRLEEQRAESKTPESGERSGSGPKSGDGGG